MSDKDFKVKNKLQVKGITSAGPVVSDASGNLDSTAYIATQYGGTGTSTSPTSGQILYSSAGTTYAPTTLSSLVTPVTYSADAPANPVVGQIWVESDSSGTSFDPNIIRRQSFTATAGQTVFTTSISFIEGYEQVYFNGLLLLRTTDYTTSGGNTVTLASAAAANDIIEVVTVTNLTAVNTYTQAEIDTALASKLSTSTAASTYLTQSSASSTYLTQSNASSTYAPLSNPTFTAIGGDEGGQINLATAATNSTLSGPVNFDVWRNKVRLFEAGGNNRGASIDLSTLSNGVGSELIAAAPQSGNTGKYLVTNGTTAVWQENIVAGKNAVINGAMDIWQRGTSFTTNNGYCADRWYTYKSAGSHTITRQLTNDTTNLPNIQYCSRIQRNSGQTDTNRSQYFTAFETVNTIPYAGKTVTVSFYARKGADYSASSSNLELSFNSGTGTDQNPINGYTGSSSLIAQFVTLTTTWQRFSVTFNMPATATEFSPNFMANWTGTAGTNDYYEITGVQLEVGSVATSFSRAGGDIQGEFAKCQRYFISYGKNQGDSALSNALGPTGVTTSTTEAVNTYTFSVKMRTIPTLTFSGTANLRGTAGLIAVTGASLGYGTSTQMATVGWTVASGLTAGQWFIIRQASGGDGAIEFSSEL